MVKEGKGDDTTQCNRKKKLGNSRHDITQKNVLSNLFSQFYTHYINEHRGWMKLST